MPGGGELWSQTVLRARACARSPLSCGRSQPRIIDRMGRKRLSIGDVGFELETGDSVLVGKSAPIAHVLDSGLRLRCSTVVVSARRST